MIETSNYLKDEDLDDSCFKFWLKDPITKKFLKHIEDHLTDLRDYILHNHNFEAVNKYLYIRGKIAMAEEILEIEFDDIKNVDKNHEENK